MRSDDAIPKEVLDFREEIKDHPELYARCGKLASFSEILAECATEVSIIVDGYYSPQEILDLLRIITGKLHAKKKKIILLH